MNIARVFAALFVAALTVPAAAPAATPLASSSFDSDDEDWSVVFFNEAVTHPVQYEEGAISVVDLTDGDTWYWHAPEAFLGDKGAAYGGTLHFVAQDVGAGLVTGTFPQAVQLVGLVDQSVWTIYCPSAYGAGQSWTTFDVTLSTAAGCWLSNGNPPTALQMTKLLSHLIALNILAEFLDGDDVASLDAVTLYSAN